MSLSKNEREARVKHLIVIAIIGWIAYHNALAGAFIWDDNFHIVNNRYIRSWLGLGELFTQDLGAGSGTQYNLYRPLLSLSFMLDYSLWKLNPFGYHLTNTLLHITVALCLYWLLNLLFNNPLLSLLTSSLFVAHPIHNEAVAYISGRADLLAAIFILLALIAYIYSYHLRRLSLYALALISLALAILSKETALIFPLVVLLYHLVTRSKPYIRQILGFISLDGLYMAIRILFISTSIAQSQHFYTSLRMLLGFFDAITNYLRLLLAPMHLHMAYTPKPFTLSNPYVLGGIAITLSLIVTAYLHRNKRPLVSFSLLWFFIFLLPVSNIYPLPFYMAEHYLYLPSIGFFLLIARALSLLYETQKRKVLASILTTILLAGYISLNIKQNNYWSDPLTFYKRTAYYVPHDPRMQFNLGIAYSAVGKDKEALECYKKAIEMEARYVEAYVNLGNAYSNLGQDKEAIAAYKKAMTIAPLYAPIYNNLARLYNRQGKIKEAMALFKKALELNPRYLLAYKNIGALYFKLGDKEKALEMYKEAIRIDPYDAQTHYALAILYYHLRRYSLAKEHCQKALELGQEIELRFIKALQGLDK